MRREKVFGGLRCAYASVLGCVVSARGLRIAREQKKKKSMTKGEGARLTIWFRF